MTEVSEDSFAKAKAFLMTAEHDGESVYEHLFRLVLKTMEENPNNIVQHPEKFLAVSNALREHRFTYGDVPIHYREDVGPDSRAVARSEVALDLYKQPEPDVTTTVTRPRPGVSITTTVVTPKPCSSFRSLTSESQFWKMCGVGLPPSEVFLLEQSLTRHVMDNDLSEVQFFGRINGTQANYYIAVTKKVVDKNAVVYEESNTMPLPPRKGVEVQMQSEPAYKGLNRFTFWVCSHAGGAWTALPDVTPDQINAARRIKKLFTGNLDAAVSSYPPFPGKEANYLRAQLARIWSSTLVCPTGAMQATEPPEPEPEPDLPEGVAPPPKKVQYYPLTSKNGEWSAPEEFPGALKDLTQWVHHTQHIFKMGRATKPPERVAQEGDPEPEEDAPEAKVEEEKELFQPVKEDKLLGVIHIPKIPTEEDEAAEDEEGEKEAEPEPEDGEGKDEDELEAEAAEAAEAALQDNDEEEDPLKKKIRSWAVSSTNTFYKKHGVVALRSLRWPGAYAYAANGGKFWGCVYFGYGQKRTHDNFAPAPAPKLQKEADDLLEVVDATASAEKLVLRGEEPKADSEDEKEEEDEPEES